MRNRPAQRRWLLLACVALLLAAGCFQQAGSDGLPATPVSQELPTSTPRPPTDTPQPPSDTPPPIPTTEGVSVAVAGTPTATLFAFPSFTPLPDSLAVQPTEVAEQSSQITDPIQLSATAFVQGATSTAAAALTGTAQALGFGLPTATETPTPTTAGLGTTTTGILGVDCVHEVRAEDRNLWRISLNYGIDVEDIARASGVANVNLISIGQRLIIPGCGTTGALPPPTSTPTLAPLSPTTAPASGTALADVTPVVPVGGTTHLVRQGETLFEISLRYGVPVASIAAANGIQDFNRIFLGQELVIPPA